MEGAQVKQTKVKSRGAQPARIRVEKVANYLLFLVTCLVTASGFVLAFRLPSGRSGKGMTLLGLDRHEWGDWHTWLAYAFLALILFHLWMVRRWIVQVAARRRGWLLLSSMGFGFALIAASLFLPVNKPDVGELDERPRWGQGR